MPVSQTKKGKFWKGLKKLVTGFLLVTGTAVAVFPRVLSHVAFPKDGTIVRVPHAGAAQTAEEIFFVPGVVRDASNLRLASRLAELTQHPITLVYNGSSCRDNYSACSKFWDYAKAGLNRANNFWTGRGNEPIITGMKEALLPSLRAEKPIKIIAHSEGALIAAEAIKDLDSLNTFNFKRVTLVVMGSPLPVEEVVKLRAIVGDVRDLSHPRDIITCFQRDVFRFPDFTDVGNWVFINPDFKECLAAGSITYHSEGSYVQQYLLEMQENLGRIHRLD